MLSLDHNRFFCVCSITGGFRHLGRGLFFDYVFFLFLIMQCFNIFLIWEQSILQFYKFLQSESIKISLQKISKKPIPSHHSNKYRNTLTRQTKKNPNPKKAAKNSNPFFVAIKNKTIKELSQKKIML